MCWRKRRRCGSAGFPGGERIPHRSAQLLIGISTCPAPLHHLAQFRGLLERHRAVPSAPLDETSCACSVVGLTLPERSRCVKGSGYPFGSFLMGVAARLVAEWPRTTGNGEALLHTHRARLAARRLAGATACRSGSYASGGCITGIPVGIGRGRMWRAGRPTSMTVAQRVIPSGAAPSRRWHEGSSGVEGSGSVRNGMDAT